MLSLSPSMYLSPYFNSEYSSEDPSVKCLSIVLTLGRIFGVIPHSRTWTWFQRDSFRFKLFSLSGFYVLVLLISSFIYCVPLVYTLIFGENTDDNVDKKERLFEKMDIPMHTIYKISVFLQYKPNIISVHFNF